MKDIHSTTTKKRLDTIKTEGILVPEREYTLKDIKDGQFIPWAKDDQTIRKIIEADHAHTNILKAKIVGSMTQKRYTLLGKDIINYLKTYGAVLIGTVRKQHGRKNKKS